MPKRKKIIYSITLGFSILFIFIMLIAHSRIKSIFADPPASPYTPGSTINPNCSPGDSYCDVIAPAISGTNNNITGLSPSASLIINGKVGIGTTTPAESLTLFGALRLGYSASSTNGGTLYYNGSDIVGYTSLGLASLTSTSTISNIGTGSSTIGFVKNINGNTVELKNIGTSTDSITLEDDTTNDLIKIGVSESNITVSNATGTLPTTKGGTGLTSISANSLYFASTTDGLLTLSLGSMFSTSTDTLSISSNIINFSEIANALTLDASLTIDAGSNYSITIGTSTMYIDTLNNRIGIATTTPQNTLVVNGTSTAAEYQIICPSGYIWVPGNPKYGTMPGFCVMKYEASPDGTSNCTHTDIVGESSDLTVYGCPISTATGDQSNWYDDFWYNISMNSAKNICSQLGPRYSLTSDQEWMTIADNIARTPINDLDSDSSLQLATGHSDNDGTGVKQTTQGADPIVSGCNLNINMEDNSNIYVAGSCEIRGTGAGGSTDNDKGYYGTGQQWSDSGYSAGLSNKSQLRTHVLSNGNVIWDIAGNIEEYSDAYIYSTSTTVSLFSEMPEPNSTTAWREYNIITNYKNLSYIKPAFHTLTSINGIGKIKTDHNCATNYGDGSCVNYGYFHSFTRGGNFGHTDKAGIYSLDFTPGLHSYWRGGFRCVYR